MNITIRQESAADQQEVFDLLHEAFKTAEIENPEEPFLVDSLRKAEAFIPELSMVAEYKGQIVGHILLTKIKIKNEKKVFDSLALAPVAVLPPYQGKGIGGMLIKQAHQKAKELGHLSIILLGHENYYPKFGYQLTEKYGVRLPFENCMALELIKGALNNVTGTVEYPRV